MNGQGSINVLATYELPIKDLTLDVSNQLLYWITDNRLYEYDLLRSSSSPIEIVTLSNDIQDRVLLAYAYDEEVEKIFVKQKGVVFYYDILKSEHELVFDFILTESSVPEQSTAMIVNHYSVQPG